LVLGVGVDFSSRGTGGLVDMMGEG
jgi:hypothetical protein